MTPCSDVDLAACLLRLCPADGGRKVFRASHPRRPELESSSPWKSQISRPYL